MRDLLEKTLTRFEELERQLVDPVLLADSSKLTAAIREHGSLNRLATKYRRFKELNVEISEAREMAGGDDLDMRELAEAELPGLIEAREALWNELLTLTLGGADANRTRCVMEIRGGTGGDEAALFARDLYEMYKRHAEVKRWKIEILDHSATELGGFKEISLSIEGEGVYRELQYESGGHRVQRVPATETQGRIHTSAATVAVMPEPEDVEVNIKPEDYRLDKFCASGPGGQHVNKTESAIRITHIPSGIVVSCQNDRSQHKNRATAFAMLRSRLYEMELEKREAAVSALNATKSDIGWGHQIRSYVLQPYQLVKDLRTGAQSYSPQEILDGDLDAFMQASLAQKLKGGADAAPVEDID